jgi:membrane protein implicated in regulation of membrane protease activity
VRYATLGARSKGRGCGVRLWFWGWLIAAAAIALVSAAARDRSSAPFALGAACAAALEAAGLPPATQWLAFVGVSAAVFVVFNQHRYRRRHDSRGLGRHGERPPQATD